MESMFLVGVLKDMDIKLGSMGKLILGNQVEIINEDGEICKFGEVGDIVVYFSMLVFFKEYYKDFERMKI